MIVYIVTAGEYSDYHICRVFLDKEKADKYVELETACDNILSYNMYVSAWETSDDDIDMNAKVVPYYFCYINHTGEIETDDDDANETEPRIDEGDVILKPDPWGLLVYSQKSFEHAKKVCIEQYQIRTQQTFEDGVD